MKKINIAEILKNCPKGMELDCTIFNDVTLYRIDTSSENEYPIRIETKNGNFLDLTKYGTYTNVEESKCLIFPKGKTTWEGFQRPFVEGDIVTWQDRGSLVACIYKERKNTTSFYHHIALYNGGIGIILDGEIVLTDDELCFATEEEKTKLFDAIKANGYKWNAYTKTLEKLVEPIFKIGNKVKRKGADYTYIVTIVKFDDDYYDYINEDGKCGVIHISTQNDWELVPNKFDITTLILFESRVLVRDNVDEVWLPCFFGGFSDINGYPYRIVGGDSWKYCVPYEGNEHLLGKTDDCDEYYKNW